MAYAAMKPTKLGLEESQVQLHKIRITLSSKNVKNLEKGEKSQGQVTNENAHQGSQNHNPKVSMWRRICALGTNTFDMFELRIHKRLIDLFSSPDVVKQITSITIEPGVEVEVTIADS